MSQYYNPRRSRNLYNPADPVPFKLSRSKIDLFLKCDRCFYLDRRMGVGQPQSPQYTLNIAVDALLKQEFDVYRAKGEAHPLIKKYGVDAVPAAHENLNQWRHNFTGVQYLHQPTNLLIFGAIDDLWKNSSGEYIVVDYKSTSKAERITELAEEWHEGYKRQMEVYQWLLRKNGHRVSNTGYFVYCNGLKENRLFDGKLDFEMTLIPYQGNDSWVEQTIHDVHNCLQQDEVPPFGEDCDHCAYIDAVNEVLKE